MAAAADARIMASILPFARPLPMDATTAPVPPRTETESETATVHDGDRWGELMLLAQDGDREAYHALLLAIAPYLRGISRRYLGHGEDCEDAVQDILLVVHGIRHTYERGRPFKPWLATIACRRCIDLLRRRTHRLRHEVDTDADSHVSTPARHDPAEAAERAHAAREVHAAVDALPQRQREAVRLLRLRELSLEEAAAHSEQSTGALKVACHRALKSLRRALQPENAKS